MKYFATKIKLTIFYLAYDFRLGREIIKCNRAAFVFALGSAFSSCIPNCLEMVNGVVSFRSVSIFYLFATIVFLIPFMVRKISHMILYFTGDRKI